MKKKPKNKEVARVYAWRVKNPDKYRKYQRELMRARRAGILQKRE